MKIEHFELPRQWAIDANNAIRFNDDGSIDVQKWNQKQRVMQTVLALSPAETQQLREFLESQLSQLAAG